MRTINVLMVLAVFAVVESFVSMRSFVRASTITVNIFPKKLVDLVNSDPDAALDRIKSFEALKRQASKALVAGNAALAEELEVLPLATLFFLYYFFTVLPHRTWRTSFATQRRRFKPLPLHTTPGWDVLKPCPRRRCASCT